MGLRREGCAGPYKECNVTLRRLCLNAPRLHEPHTREAHTSNCSGNESMPKLLHTNREHPRAVNKYLAWSCAPPRITGDVGISPYRTIVACLRDDDVHGHYLGRALPVNLTTSFPPES